MSATRSEAAARLGDEPGPVRGQQVRRRTVGHGDALGAAGGAGGVDDVRGVLGVQRGAPVGVGGVGVRGGRGYGAQGGLVQDEGRAGVVQQVPDAFGGQGRVQRQVAGAGLPDGEDRDDHVRRAREPQRHQPLGAGAERDEVVGEPVGPGVERGVVQPFAARGEGGASGVGPRGARRSPGTRSRPRGAAARRSSRGRHAVSRRRTAGGRLPSGRSGASTAPSSRRSSCPASRSAVAGSNRSVRYSSSPVSAAPSGTNSMLRSKVAALPGDGDRGGGESARGGRGGRVGVQQDHHVEQRVAARLAGCADRLHDPLERRVAVREGVAHRAGRPRQQLAEGTGGVHRGAQHDRVHEEPDGPLRSVRDRPGSGSRR